MTMCCNDINVPQYANLVHVLFLYIAVVTMHCPQMLFLYILQQKNITQEKERKKKEKRQKNSLPRINEFNRGQLSAICLGLERRVPVEALGV